MLALDPDIEQRDYARKPLTREEIRELVALAGLPAAMNTRHALVKERGWKDRTPTTDEFVEAALADNNLLRRPIVVRDGKAVVGLDAPAFERLLG